MKTVFFLLLPFSLFALDYPFLAQDPRPDVYHGTLVADPYRFLEDSSSPETRAWIDAENRLTSNILKEIPELFAIRERVEALTNYERVLSFVKRGERTFFSMNRGLQNQPVFYTCLDEKPEVLLDLNALSPDGTISVTVGQVSKKGEWFAYGLSFAGSDWTEVRIRNSETKEDLPETLRWIKFSRIAWLPDASGFYYCRFDAPKEEEGAPLGPHQLYFHALRTSQESDRLIFAAQEGDPCHLTPFVSEEGELLLISLEKGFGLCNAIYLYESDSCKPLFPDFDAKYHYIGNRASRFWFLTDRGAPLCKVIAIDLDDWIVKEWIPEGECLLESAALIGEKLVLNYLENGSSRLVIHGIDGVFEETIPLPSPGSADLILGDEIFFSFCSFKEPLSIYSYSTGAVHPLFHRRLPFSPDDFETKTCFYPSKDGTPIPLLLTYKKGLSLEEPHPVYLYGYGGFNVILKPFFSSEWLAWMEMDGILAIPNLRGGGEQGKSWHEAGMLEKKQTVFDDFLAAAEWLVSEGVTTPSSLAIGGGSNGGLLVSACLNQRPDLFGAAISMVGVHDMLRYHLFTAGRLWVTEYGSSEDPEQFSVLYRYSPLHNIREGAYPPTFILTADHDDRVVPLHSYKYAAALQQAQTAEHPILLRVTSSTGHGWGKPIHKQIEEAAEKLAFLRSQLCKYTARG